VAGKTRARYAGTIAIKSTIAYIFQPAADAVKPQDIFYAETDCKKPFGSQKNPAERAINSPDTVRNDHRNACENADYDKNIKPLPGRGVRLEDNLVQQLLKTSGVGLSLHHDRSPW
jgi:hypothetical protein